MHVLAEAAFNAMTERQRNLALGMNYNNDDDATVANMGHFNDNIMEGMCDSTSDCASRTMKAMVSFECKFAGACGSAEVEIPTPNCCSCCSDTNANGTSATTTTSWGEYMWGAPYTKGADTCVPDINTAWELRPCVNNVCSDPDYTDDEGQHYTLHGTLTPGAVANPCATDAKLCGGNSCCVDNDIVSTSGGRRHVLSHELIQDGEDFEEMDDNQLGLTHMQLGPTGIFPSGTEGGGG